MFIVVPHDFFSSALLFTATSLAFAASACGSSGGEERYIDVFRDVAMDYRVTVARIRNPICVVIVRDCLPADARAGDPRGGVMDGKVQSSSIIANRNIVRSWFLLVAKTLPVFVK
jgi:hypothetical protein